MVGLPRLQLPAVEAQPALPLLPAEALLALLQLLPPLAEAPPALLQLLPPAAVALPALPLLRAEVAPASLQLLAAETPLALPADAQLAGLLLPQPAVWLQQVLLPAELPLLLAVLMLAQ